MCWYSLHTQITRHNSIYCSSMNVCGLGNMSDSQTSVFFQHVINNFNIFATCCVFGRPEWCSSSTLFLPCLNLASQLFATLYAGGIVAQCIKHITMNRFARHFFKEQIFYNCAFFQFIHIYIIFYHSKYRLLNFVISQRQNDVNCINNYVNELSFSYCNEFNLYPKFPSEAGSFWNNPRM